MKKGDKDFLYNIPRNSRVSVKHLELTRTDNREIVDEIDFHHIDGMYSLCYLEEDKPIHLSVGTEVIYLGPIKPADGTDT